MKGGADPVWVALVACTMAIIASRPLWSANVLPLALLGRSGGSCQSIVTAPASLRGQAANLVVEVSCVPGERGLRRQIGVRAQGRAGQRPEQGRQADSNRRQGFFMATCLRRPACLQGVQNGRWVEPITIILHNQTRQSLATFLDLPSPIILSFEVPVSSDWASKSAGKY
jgi:hypothetical protein